MVLLVILVVTPLPNVQVYEYGCVPPELVLVNRTVCEAPAAGQAAAYVKLDVSGAAMAIDDGLQVHLGVIFEQLTEPSAFL